MRSNKILAALALTLEVIAIVTLAVAVSSALIPAVATSAQTAGPFNLAVACDDDAYPEVTCEAAITDDRFGVPKPYGADQVQFRVVDVDAGKPVETRLVTPTQPISVSLLLVVDSRAILETRVPGGAPGTMMQTAKSIGDFLNLSQLTPGDQLAVLVPTTTMSALPDFDERVDSIFVSAPSATVDPCPTYVQICNPLVQRARPAPIMPIYRALDRAIARIKGQPGRRAVVLVSDGNKVNAQELNQDLVIARADEADVPIFVVEYGAKRNDALLRPLADLTGGSVFTATKVDELDERMAEIHKRLKAHYGLTFTAQTPSDNGKHRFEITAEVANVGQAQASPEVVAFFPVKPAIVGTLISTTNAAQSFASGLTLEAALADQARLGRQFEISPVVQLRGQIGKIEYRLNDRPLGTGSGSLRISAKEMMLAEGITHTLRIRAEDTQSNGSDERRYDFIIEGCTGVCWVQENPALAAAYAAAAMAVLAVVSLIGFAIARLAQSRRNMPPAARTGRAGSVGRDVATKPEPKTSSAFSASSIQVHPVVAPMPSPNGSSNAGMNGTSQRITAIPPAPGGAAQVSTRPRVTRILDEQPKAFLEFASDNVSHKRVGIGGHDGKSVVFGWDMREDDPDNQVRVKSDFVSRTHAEIRQQGEDLFLIDLNSKSGTWLEGERIPANRPVPIKPGSKIKFADVGAIVREA